MIIGTAGHIDHGKTALVKALTGVDADRLKEEKARGITIDLGFAYLPTATGQILGFVDVPGHERFVHTMLAGAGGIDFVLLTIAADDGIKPQTREHLAIVDLLGIGRGIAVITKADLATPERLAALTAEIRALLAGTTLENSEVLPVSALTGRGIDALQGKLAAAARQTSDRSMEARFRLAVDRVFTLQGVGVIVTGTILSGLIRAGDRVVVSPPGLSARVRSLHAQNRPADIGRTGERSALNLTGPGISKDAITRGDVVLNADLHAPTARVDAVLRLSADAEKPIGQWFPVRLHHAAAEVGARIVLLDDRPIAPGTASEVQLVLDRPIAAAVPDRFVIRDVSARRTLGGGRFIDLQPPQRRRRTPERQAQRAALAIADPVAAFAALLGAPPFASDVATFARDRALTGAQAERLAAQLDLITFEDGTARVAMLPDRWRMFAADLSARVSAFHAENPDLQGIGREQLRLMLMPRLTKPTFVAALQRLAGSDDLVLDGSFVRLATHQVTFAAEDEIAWETIAPLLGDAQRFRPPRVRDIATATGRPEAEVRRLLKLAGQMGRADEIARDHFFLRSTVHEMVRIATDLAIHAEGGVFTAAQFRDRLDNGRKVAIQILEFFDRHGITLKRGDLRRINRHRLDLFADPALASGGAAGGESSLVGRSDFKSEWGSETVPGGFDSHSPSPKSPAASSPPRSSRDEP